MNRSFRIPALIVLLTTAGACARPVHVTGNVPAPEGSVSSVIVQTGDAIPAGTELQVTLDQRIGTADSRVGQAFYATLQTPVLDARRAVLIPAGARVSGTITALRPSSEVATPAVVRVHFDRLWVGSRSSVLDAEVVNTGARLEDRGTDAAIRDATRGAAAGAVIGAVLGRDIQSVLRGAVLGAGAGTVISLGTGERDAVLAQGTWMVLRLNQPLAIPR